MSHTFLTCAGHVAAQRTSDPRASLETRRCGGHRVHPISITNTCSVGGLSKRDEQLTWRHVEGSESFDRHRCSSVINRDRSLHPDAWTAVMHRDNGGLPSGGGHSSRSCDRDGWEDSWKKSTIVVRSNSDRGAIKPRSWLLHRGINTTILPIPGAQFPLKTAGEKSLIEARSPLDRGHDQARSWLPLKPNQCWFVVGLKPRSMPKESLPRRIQTAPTRTHQSATIFGRNFPLKACILPSCSSTFDRFVKWIKQISRKISSSSWSPAFRLNCEAIGAGLIANSPLISSNFPLEFRTSTRKNPSKFTSIHENWSPIIAEIRLVVIFDRLSWGNLSFYYI